MAEKISVIIPTKNRAQDVLSCLESIMIQSSLPHEVVIVDSSDTEELKYELNKFDSFETKYIHSRVGMTRARNIGAENCSGGIIIFLDDDVILNKGYIEKVLDVFNAFPAEKLGGVTGRVSFKDREGFFRYGFIYQAFATIFFLRRYGNGCFLLSGMQTYIRPDVTRITECEYLHGCNMAFRKSVFDEFKSDESFYGYSLGEDADLSYRVSRKYQNIYTPFAKVLHNKSQSARANRYAVMKMEMENLYYIFTKNFPQDFKHKLAFRWSTLGLFLVEIVRGMIERDISRVKGLISGFISINKKSKLKKVKEPKIH